MRRFQITATVSVEVNLDVMAGDIEAARAIFLDHISMTANLVDLASGEFEVYDDTISDIEDVHVRVQGS